MNATLYGNTRYRHPDQHNCASASQTMCFHQFKLLCACFMFGCVIKCAYCSSLEAKSTPFAGENSKHLSDQVLLQNDVFLKHIFAKYGKDGWISFDGFQQLMKNLLEDRARKTDCDSHHEGNKPVLENGKHSHFEVDENLENNRPTLASRREDIGHSKSLVQGPSHLHNDFVWNWTSLLELSPANSSSLSVAVGEKCISTADLFRSFHFSHQNGVSPLHFANLCPAIIYELDRKHCVVHDKLENKENTLSPSAQTWLFSTLAVVVISLCGLLSVAIVPLIHSLFYQSLLQFLIGLAVGSLSGDALLHLLPHAMTGLGHSDHQGATNTGEIHDDHEQQETYIWTGLVALSGIYIFYIAERLLNITMACYSGKKTLKATSQVSRLTFAVRSMDSEQCKTVGEKLSHHKHGSYGYQFDRTEMENLQKADDGLDEQHTHEKLMENPEMQEMLGLAGSDGETRSSEQKAGDVSFSVDQNGADNVDVCHTERVIFQNSDEPQSCVVAVTDHHHHSHRHTHGSVSNTISAVAWMVIMGDGLHNLCDGLAIGAAFVGGLSSGLSTTVAVFCHELPHELGDFAMLLKAGMPVKQALLYNGLSSFLCFLGMLMGVFLGSVGSATLWVFAGAAGMFLYIALVDMLPELDNVASQSVSTSVKHFTLQILGIVLGVTIMLLIALYEHELKHLIR